jgi:3-hydroxyisobutyrate dehydrogenase/2-hydroxy-3-oxopropionate reductase
VEVAVLGLGAMGSRMARRLLDAGHRVVVWNRTPEKTAPLVAAGAAAAPTPAAAAEQVDVVITMLANAEALLSVSEGADGFVRSLRPGQTVAEMSTVGPAAVERLRAVVPEDVAVIDAPVLGSVGEAEAGTLVVFVGGSEDAARRVEPLFQKLGSPVYVGSAGSGAAAKLVANSALLGAIAALGECLALAEGLGLAHAKAFEVLARTPLGAQAERRREAFESGSYPKRFGLSLARKDAGLVADAAAEAGVDLRLAPAVLAWLADAERAGDGDSDYAAVLRTIAPSFRA